MSQATETAKEIKPRIKSILQWFWAIMLIASVALLISGAYRFQRVLSSASWPTVPGTVDVSELEYDHLFRGILNYKLKISYHYNVNGTRYEGNRVSYSDQTSYIGRTSGEHDVKRALETYPKGASVTVHHHPTDPGLAVIETGIAWHQFKSLPLGLCMALLAATGLWRRWSLQTDYLFRPHDPDAPMTVQKFVLGALGLMACLGIAWIWWELIKMYAGR